MKTRGLKKEAASEPAERAKKTAEKAEDKEKEGEMEVLARSELVEIGWGIADSLRSLVGTTRGIRDELRHIGEMLEVIAYRDESESEESEKLEVAPEELSRELEELNREVEELEKGDGEKRRWSKELEIGGNRVGEQEPPNKKQKN